MADDVVHDLEDVVTAPAELDILDHEPTKSEKLEMRKAIKPPSEWLKLLCKQWADENLQLVDSTDAKFMDYKPYLKGMLTSQLLVRLSIPPITKDFSLDGSPSPSTVDFWRILGIEDEFDKSYIQSQVERFCALYNVRGLPIDEVNHEPLFDYGPADPTALQLNPSYLAGDQGSVSGSDSTKKQATEVSKAHRMAKDAEKALELERRHNMKKEQIRAAQARKEQKAREREIHAARKAQEKAAREASREEKRRKKVEIREQREKFAKEQKEAALRRAAELVTSNRVPIEITRGAAAAKAAANLALAATMPPLSAAKDQPPPVPENKKKARSAIVVSTAADLNQVVSHAKALFAKYNAIAKEHNQKINWNVVAKELGIHVKVREKYSRMHARAEARGFDWIRFGDWKIKDHPEIFHVPTEQERKLKILPRSSDEDGNMEPTTFVGGPLHHQYSVPHTEIKHEMNTTKAETELSTTPTRNTDEDPETIAAAAAAVVDASVNHVPSTEEQAAAAAAIVSATIERDHTEGVSTDHMMGGDEEAMNRANSNNSSGVNGDETCMVVDPTQHLVDEHLNASSSHHEV